MRSWFAAAAARRRIALVNWRTAKEAAKAAFRAQAVALGDTSSLAAGTSLVSNLREALPAPQHLVCCGQPADPLPVVAY